MVDEFDSNVARGTIVLNSQTGIRSDMTTADDTQLNPSEEDHVALCMMCPLVEQDEPAPNDSDSGRVESTTPMQSPLNPEEAITMALTRAVELSSLPDDMAPRYEDAIKGPHADKWRAAAQKEIDSCIANDTWKEVKRTP